MKSSTMFRHMLHDSWTSRDVPARMRDALRELEVSWYRAAVILMAICAVSMDLFFPPVRVAIANGVDIYAGHASVPLSISGAVHVDALVLSVELAVIMIAAVVGWHLGASAHDKQGRAAGRR